MPSQVTIDLITYDGAHDEFVLYLVEDGPWPCDWLEWDNCLSRIQQRIFNAVEVAVDGHLAARYPESVGKKVRVQIDSPHGVPPRLNELVCKVRECLESDQEYRSAIEQSQFIRGLRVVLGHEIGRFSKNSDTENGIQYRAGN